MIGISSRRCSSLDAFNEMASLGLAASGAAANSAIFGMIPDVDTVIRRARNPETSRIAQIRIAFSTAGRFSSGSPCPMNTMLIRF